jgi:hypothetical protein
MCHPFLCRFLTDYFSESAQWYRYQCKHGENLSPILCIEVEASECLSDGNTSSEQTIEYFHGHNTNHEGTVNKVEGTFTAIEFCLLDP